MPKNRISFAVSEEERKEIESDALAQDRRLSEFCRLKLGLPALIDGKVTDDADA